MKDYIDRMLHLTADIAEELLTLKDTGSDVSDELCDKIDTLAMLAKANSVTVDTPAEPDEDRYDDIEHLESEALETVADSNEESALEREERLVDDEETGENAEQEQIMDADETGTEESHLEQENLSEQEEEIRETSEEIACATEFEETADAGDAGNDTQAYSEETYENAPRPAFSASDLRNAFTLNDVFLYQRTLFGGVPQRFKETLEALSRCRSMEEARRYLLEVQKVDLKSDEAQDFLAIVSPFIPQTPQE